jgi:MFS family permease
MPRTAILRVTAVLSLIAIEALLFGFSYPYFSIALEQRQLPNWLIGLNASIAGAGILILGPFLPKLIEAMGLRWLVAAQFLISFLSFAILLATDNLVIWFAARLIMGACFSSLWTTTEIWLNGVSPEAHRGRIIGASGTLYAGFQFVGPLLLGQTGAAGSLPIVAAMLPLAVGVIIAVITPSMAGEPEDDEPEGNVAGLVAALPIAGALIAASFITGIGETAMQSLLPVYGLQHGLDVAQSSRLVAIFSLGEAVLVAFLGWASDRFGRRTMMLCCLASAVVSCLLIPLTISMPLLLWPILFVAGGTVAGLYTLGVVLIGQDFSGQRLAIVATGFAMAYSAGSVLGSTPIGAAMDWLGKESLPIGIAILFGALFLILLRRGKPAKIN